MMNKKKEDTLEPVQQNILIPITSLFAHEKNYRQHPPEQITMLKASLERWGQVRSLVVTPNNDGTYTIVAGHGVVLAAQELVNAHTSYYERFGKLRADIIPQSWNRLQIEGYIAADNQLSLHATDDDQLLAQLLQEQSDAGFDLASLGTDEETLRQMLEALSDEVIGGDLDNEESHIPGIDAPDLPYKNQFAVAVICESEDQQQTIFETLTKQGYNCKVLVV